MVDPDRRPTAQEIEELIDLVRRDPSSPAFIDLGEAYLSLGRPRDAVQVGNLGLDSAPDNLEGRVMLARAHAAMHQWKEAQGELLRVVKVDRSSRMGFALLGEVLLRRSDFERAVPVLQHAQNLDPTSPAILAMLRRARAGQPLDPPPPIPQPIPPRGETANPADIVGSDRGRPPPPAAKPRTMPPMPPGPAAQAMPTVPSASPVMATMAIEPAMEMRRDAGPPAGYPDASPLPSARGPKQTAPPPLSVEGVRPRIVSSVKQQNAAAASLRQSAAVGETYLNDLLTGGLLDVAGVRVPEGDFDLRPDRRWGRSTRRAFIFLFVVLVLGIGGGGTWYWWTEKQKTEAVAQLQRDSKLAIGGGDFNGLEASITKLADALDKDKSNLLTHAYVAEVTGLEALLYGTDADRASTAIKHLKDLQPGDPGEREVVVGKVAVELSRLHLVAPEAAAASLAEVGKLLDGYLVKHDDDRWVRWLKGRALLAAGERKAARAMFKSAGEGSDGLAVAVIDQADLLVDDGKLDDAMALYKKAEDKSKDHPLAVLGRLIARAEAGFEVGDAIGELNAKFIKTKLPPRTAAYRWLALALANLSTEDYKGAIDALHEATSGKPPGEPRFWARIAWGYYMLGDLAESAKARGRVVWYGKKREDDPTVQLVDVAQLIASGLPEKAFELAAKIEGTRPRMLRVYALIDLGKYAEAITEADEILKTSPQNIDAAILREQANATSATTDRDRADRAEALRKLALKTKGKLGRHALGMVRLAANDIPNAKVELETAITEVSDTSPNPLAYRTLTALAEVALAEKDVVGAGKFLDWALDSDAARRPEIVLANKTVIRALENKKRTPYADFLKANSGYFPTLAMQARVVLRNKEPDRALRLLEPIFKESAAVTSKVNLTFAEALITRKGSTLKDKERAKQIIASLREDKTVTLGELGRIAALIDLKLPKELELPPPTDDGEAAAPTPPKGAKRPGRRGR